MSKSFAQSLSFKLPGIFRGLYGVFSGAALVLQIYLSVSTWQYTISYDYFCGNPLMGAWARWFWTSLVVGLILLIGALGALVHKRMTRVFVYGIAFSAYAASMLFLWRFGQQWGTVPDFLPFPAW